MFISQKMSNSMKKSQLGITFLELAAGIGIIAILAVFLVPRMVAVSDNTKLELANQEILALITQTLNYRNVNRGDYSSLAPDGIAGLVANGYNLDPFTSNALPENIFGKTAALTAAGTNANLVYSAGDGPGCEQLADRILEHSDVLSADCSGTEILTMVID